MPISSAHHDLFHQSNTSDKMTLFRSLLDSGQLAADEALALLNSIHTELEQARGDRDIYLRYAELMQSLRQQRPDVYDQVAVKWRSLHERMHPVTEDESMMESSPKKISKQKETLTVASKGKETSKQTESAKGHKEEAKEVESEEGELGEAEESEEEQNESEEKESEVKESKEGEEEQEEEETEKEEKEKEEDESEEESEEDSEKDEKEEEEDSEEESEDEEKQDKKEDEEESEEEEGEEEEESEESESEETEEKSEEGESEVKDEHESGKEKAEEMEWPELEEAEHHEEAEETESLAEGAQIQAVEEEPMIPQSIEVEEEPEEFEGGGMEMPGMPD
jgi:hypothetical protein